MNPERIRPEAGAHPVGPTKGKPQGVEMTNMQSRGGRPRLTQPMVRENGALRPASWEEALDRVARGFAQNKAKHGPNAFGIFSCSKTTNEMNYTAQKFIRVVMGSNNIDSCNRT